MNIVLPSGCNIINSATSFYNYTNNNYTRKLYYIIDGNVYLSSTTTQTTRPYDYTGECLTTGDLIYKPETDVYFQFMAIISVVSILIFIYWLLFKGLLKK